MRHLITGANGFLGSWLARRLVERGDKVRCLIRSGSDDSALAGIDCERATGDVTQPDSLEAALKNIDVVFHLAGIRRAATRADYMRVNADGTQVVCDAMVKAGTRRLVLCSSLAASGPSSADRPRVESDPFCPEEWYGESKAEAERIAFGYCDRLEVTCCRPSRIVGPGDRENLTFFKMVQKGIVLRLGGPERFLSMVDVEDVVSLLVLMADRKEAVGQAFFGSSQGAISVEGLMTMIADVLKVKTRTVYVPQTLLTVMATGADVVSQVTGTKLPLNRKLARQLLAPGWTCSIEKAQRVLGYSPKLGLRESAQRSADGYRQAGWL
jgi:dihydroflavonol-4-reductase